MKQIRKRLTYANVMSSIAVFLVIGGATAFAAGLAKNSVGTKQLKKNAVNTAKIKKNAVTAAKIKNGAVGESKLADNAVTTNKVADNAVTTTKIADNAVTTAKIANDAVTGDKVKESSLGEVPSAANAANANAVNQQTLASFFKEIPNNGAGATVIEFGGVKVAATCTALVPVLTASKVSGEAAAARFGNVENTTEVFGNGQSTFSTLTLGNGKTLGSGTLEVVFANGRVTTVSYAWRDDAFSGSGCRFFGRVTAG